MSEDDVLVRYTEKVSALLEKRSDRLSEGELKALAQELGLSAEDIALAEKEARAHLERGQGYLRNQLLEEAIKELESAHTLSPNNPEVMITYAEALVARFEQHRQPSDRQRSDRQLAEKLAQRLLEDRPSDQRAFNVIKRLKAQRRKSGAPLATVGAVAIVAMIAVGVLFALVLRSPSARPARSSALSSSPPPRAAPQRAPRSQRPPRVMNEPEAPRRVQANLPRLPQTSAEPQRVLPIDGGVPLVFHPGPSGEGLSLTVYTSSYDQAGRYAIDGRLQNGGESEYYGLTLGLELLDGEGARLGAKRMELESGGYRPGDQIPIFGQVQSEGAPKQIIVRIEGATAAPTPPLYEVPRALELQWEVPRPAGASLTLKQRKLVSLLEHTLTVELHNEGPAPIAHLELEKRLLQEGAPAELSRVVVAQPGTAPALRPGEVRIFDLASKNIKDATASLHVVRFQLR